MLDFFRRYQKGFFLVITAVIICSFTFFGTFSTFSDSEKVADRVVGKAIDGSDMMEQELRAMERFLAFDRDDFWQPNLFNDGVIRHDLLATKVAEVMVERSLPMFREGLALALQRAKAYVPYEHPEASFLSAKAVWERAAPMINREWSQLRAASEPSREVFAHLVNLHQFQSAVSPEWLRRVLLMQEQQYNWIHPDPRLRQEDLSMFGFHTLSDWFGKEFVGVMAQFVHNGAIWAKQKGYEATFDEAKADLRRVFAESVERRGLEKVSYREALRIAGVSESEAVSVWRKVLSLRRCFNDLGKSAWVDRLPYEEFVQVAAETARVDVYQWPLTAEIKTAADALAFETYLDAVSVRKKTDRMALPEEFLPVKQVPAELVASRYTAKVFAVDKREAALLVPLKELWDFETREKTWKLLAKEFSSLQDLPAKSVEERFASLETLDAKVRGKVDLFARRLVLEEHPEWLQEALNRAKPEEKELIFSAGKIEMDHVQDPKRLGTLFEQILTTPEQALTALDCFQSGDAVFRFQNIAKVSEPVLKTFVEAKRDGSLDLLVRGRSAGTARQWMGLAKAVQDELKQNRTAMLAAPKEPALTAQFKLHRTEMQVSRTTAEDWMVQETFSLKPQQWSNIHQTPDGCLTFLHLKERGQVADSIAEPLDFGHAAIAADVQRCLAQELFDAMLARKE